MSKKNEDSLERFFRKAVSQHDTAFRESDWLKLEKMLDEKAERRAAGRLTNLRRIGYSLAGLAIILTGIYFLTLDGNASKSTEVLPEQMQVAAGEEAPVTDNVKEKPAAGLHSSIEALADNIGEKKSTPVESLATLPKPASDEKHISGKNSNAASLPGQSSEPEAGVPGIAKPGSNKKSEISTHLTTPNTTPVDVRKSQPLPSQNPAGQRKKSIGDSGNTVLSVVTNSNTPKTDNTPKIDKALKADNGSETGNTSAIDTSSKTDRSRHQPAGSLESQGRSDLTRIPEAKLEGFNRATDNNTTDRTTDNRTADVTGKTEVLPVAGDPLKVANLDDHRKLVGQDAQRADQVIKRPAQIHAQNTHAEDSAAPEREKIPLLKRADEDSVAEEEVVDKTTLPDEKMRPVPTRWNVALMLAPDFSSTALERYTAPGEAYGFAVGYRFLGRLTATTGLVRSTKKYVGYGSDYQPPEGYWNRRTNGIIPDDITGTCAILEIPLTLQYVVNQKEKSRMYFAVGLSSYIMLSESYRYSFDAPNPGAARGWSTSKSSTYPFAIGHLSAAYERNLSQRWAIGLEPFLKIPFAGVGWTNVDLYSTGVFFNLRYRFFRKQQFTVPEERKTTH